jgi:hypothetical protein
MPHVIRLMAVIIWCALAVFPADTARPEKRLALAVGVDVYDNPFCGSTHDATR